MTANAGRRLVVAYVMDPRVREELRQFDCDLQLVSSRQRMLATEYQRQPSIFLIQASSSDVDQTRELAASLRHRRPLTDVLIWAPRAAGSAVRDYFRAGVKDVIVSQSAGSLITSLGTTLDQQRLLPRVNDLSRQRSRTSRFESMLSRSQAMWDLFELCAHIAPTAANVLIVGETGTGKELLARAIHRRSQRRGRFVAANCASIPPELINSELFGHERGAFTGADRDKRGLVRHAHEGTLFLDEIGDMSPEGQQSLLRMLQERRIRPVGSLVETKVDVRVVAATNVPLDQAVRTGDFREDLFYRLDVIRMNVPPLRARPEDILFLFGYMMKRLAKHYGVEPPIFADSFADALVAYQWPGNVRQLENFSERLVLARPQRALTDRDFAKLCSTSHAPDVAVKGQQRQRLTEIQVDPAKPLQANIDPTVADIERAYLQAVLTKTAGRVAQAAEQAGISRRTMLRKMKSYGIDKQAFRT